MKRVLLLGAVLLAGCSDRNPDAIEPAPAPSEASANRLMQKAEEAALDAGRAMEQTNELNRSLTADARKGDAR